MYSYEAFSRITSNKKKRLPQLNIINDNDNLWSHDAMKKTTSNSDLVMTVHIHIITVRK